MLNRWRTALPHAVALVFVLVGGLALATPHAATASGLQSIDERDRVVLLNNVHPLARRELEVRRTDLDLPMERMILALALRPGAQAQLDQHLAAQHDPASPQYHRWLTPEQFGARFGLRDADLALVTNWLQGQGFAIDKVAKGRGWINFSGTVAQVERAFATEIHDYEVEGKIRHANAIDPSIPRALESLVQGVVTLHSFPIPSQQVGLRKVSPEELRPDFNDAAGDHFLAPADFATIHDLSTLYSTGINGTGRTIGIVGRTDIRLADVQYFRGSFGLPANDPVFIHNGPDPGIVSDDEETAGDLAVEWAGAVGRNATVKYVISKSTAATDGLDLSAQYIVDNNLADSMSTSLVRCESSMGSAELAFYDDLRAQAASQGITSFVSSGDPGAAGCTGAQDTKRDIPDVSLTAAGHDGYLIIHKSGLYSVSGTSASSPSLAGLMSLIVQKTGLRQGNDNAVLHPVVRKMTGDPNFTMSASPNAISISRGASGHVTITTSVFNGFSFPITLTVSGLPSGVTASFSSTTIIAPGAGTSTLTFTVSSSTAPGVYSIMVSGTGGSLNRNTTVTLTVSNFTIAASPSSLSIMQGSSGTSTISTTTSGNFSSTVALSASGLPSGVTYSFSPSSITTPATGSSTLTFMVSPTAAAGSYTITITGTGGGITHTTTVTLNVISSPDFTVSASPSAPSISIGTSGQVSITTAIFSGFNSAITLTAFGLPSGVTASFSPTSIGAPGAGTSTLTLTVTNSTALGTYSIMVIGNGGAFNRTTTVTLRVTL